MDRAARRLDRLRQAITEHAERRQLPKLGDLPNGRLIAERFMAGTQGEALALARCIALLDLATNPDTDGSGLLRYIAREETRDAQIDSEFWRVFGGREPYARR